MNPRLMFVALSCGLILASECRAAAGVKAPVPTDPRLEISLVASEPDIVTPIGLAIDKRGRLFAVESHTHFPKTNYPGPKFDRVKFFGDTGKDGKPKQISVFADGLHHSMNLAFGPDGALYLTHRNGVLRLDDKDGDGVSEARATILQMDTPGDYPHNGIGGITFSPDGWLYVGQGENLGEGYTLKGSDGSSHGGKGEGGNVFRCRPDGSRLQRVATGFWNPFGLGFYGRQFLLALDNDPDSRPPNRLLDVVMGGDYGFKFRFGRNGLHPFQAWNGELPGTLPMVSGTGEGACNLLPCDQTSLPSDYHEAVLVAAAWDHQIEVHRPKPFGASLRADREVLVQGDESFRPVGLAAAPDGSVYFTDWVDASYNVHGQGRIWRLSTKAGAPSKPGSSLAFAANSSRKLMQRLLAADKPGQFPELRAALSNNDPFVNSATVNSLSKPIFRAAVEKELENKSPAVRLGALLALRRAGAANAGEVVGRMLADPDEQVRLMAVIWAGEQELTSVTNRLSLALATKPVSPVLLRAHAATAHILAKAGRVQPGASGGPAKLTFFDLTERVDPQPFLETLKASPARTPLQARLDAVRHLAQSTDPVVVALLKRIASDRKADAELRAEAIVALAGTSESSNLMVSLLEDSAAAVRFEAARALRSQSTDPTMQAALKTKLAQVQGHDPALAEQLHFTLSARGGHGESPKNVPSRPQSDEEWRTALAGKADASSGRRVFFHPAVGCARCHRIEEFGGNIGPDLSTIARGADREKLLQSILHPSRDIAPQFVSHTVETKDGQEFTGLLIGQSVNEGVTLFMADSRAVLIPPGLIASQTQSKLSLMPEDLAGGLTVQDFRDLLAFVLSRK